MRQKILLVKVGDFRYARKIVLCQRTRRLYRTRAQTNLRRKPDLEMKSKCCPGSLRGGKYRRAKGVDGSQIESRHALEERRCRRLHRVSDAATPVQQVVADLH